MTPRILHVIEWTGETVFITAMLLLAIVGFMTLLGAFDPLASPLTVLGGVATFAVWAGHARWVRRNMDEVVRAERPARERRGF